MYTVAQCTYMYLVPRTVHLKMIKVINLCYAVLL